MWMPWWSFTVSPWDSRAKTQAGGRAAVTIEAQRPKWMIMSLQSSWYFDTDACLWNVDKLVLSHFKPTSDVGINPFKFFGPLDAGRFSTVLWPQFADARVEMHDLLTVWAVGPFKFLNKINSTLHDWWFSIINCGVLYYLHRYEIINFTVQFWLHTVQITWFARAAVHSGTFWWTHCTVRACSGIFVLDCNYCAAIFAVSIAIMPSKGTK